MGIYPEHAHFLVPLPIKARRARHRAGRDGVVATQHQRRLAALQGLRDLFRKKLAGAGDFGQEAGVPRPRFTQGFRLRGLDIAYVPYFITQHRQTSAQARHAQRRGAHIHAPATLA